MKWLLLVGLAACATASPAEHNPGGGDGVDASTTPGPDASTSQPDAPAPPGSVTLQQTADMTIANGNSVTCVTTTGQDPRPAWSNSWYRVFPLADHQITGAFHATKVSFGVESASGSPELTVSVGTYNGTGPSSTLSLSAITVLATASVTVPDSDSAIVEAPITADVPAGSKLIVEVSTPSLVGTDQRVFIGSTTSAETHGGFARAAHCAGNDTPVPVANIKLDSHLLITVTGTK